MAKTADVHEDPPTTEREAAAQVTSGPVPAEAVTPPRRFYANLADL